MLHLLSFATTVNAVIFAGGNFAKMLARHFTWGDFHDTTHISFIKEYLFSCWDNVHEEDECKTTATITPTQRLPR